MKHSAGLWYGASRRQDEPFDSLDRYLRGKAGNFIDAKMCHALAAVNAPLVDQYRKVGYPWATLVLGSGCLEARELSAGLRVDALPEIVAALLQGRGHRVPGAGQEDGLAAAPQLARDFVQSLVEDRLSPITVAVAAGGPAGGPLQPGETIEVWKAELVLVTALLTRLYHLIRAQGSSALSRQGGDRASTADVMLAGDIQGEWQPPISRLIHAVVIGTGNIPELGQLRAVLQRVQDGVQGQAAELTLSDLQLLTELSWFFLTQGTTVYPGWSDLLLALSLHENGPNLQTGHPRPAFDDITDASEQINRRYEEVTAESWKSLGSRPVSDRDRFYGAVAAVLRRQSELRRATRARNAHQPPPASVFVTTFDLELEMALWAGSTDPFVLALPVNVLRRRRQDPETKPDLATAVWLGCVIRPTRDGDQLAQLRKPRDWFLFTDWKDLYDWKEDQDWGGRADDEEKDMPIVVRLNGCPLLTLPPLTDENGEYTAMGEKVVGELLGGVPPRKDDTLVRMEHAVLIDDHAAMRHIVSEMYWQVLRQGLPPELTAGDKGTFSRFWMLMGAQVGDSGVRFRLASQMLAPVFSDQGGDDVTPLRAGVAVNRRIDAAVSDLLHWYEFDVVRDQSERMTDHLLHYLRHLEEESPDARRGRARGRCTLP